MPLFAVRLKTVSPWLGDLFNGRLRVLRRFEGEYVAGHIALEPDHARWRWAFAEACSVVVPDCNPAMIGVPQKIITNRVTIYHRRYRKKGVLESETMESIPPDATLKMLIHCAQTPHDALTMSVHSLKTLARQVSKDWAHRMETLLENLTAAAEIEKKPPTKYQLMVVMNYIGQHIGMSPWGSSTGFGKFSVKSIEELSPGQIDIFNDDISTSFHD